MDVDGMTGFVRMSGHTEKNLVLVDGSFCCLDFA